MGASVRPGRGLRTVLLVLLFGVLGAYLGAVANAYWRSGAAGIGSAAATSAAAVAVSAGSPTATLYPGGQSGVALTVSNPNRFPVRIGALTLDTGRRTAGFSVDAGHSGCAVSALSFTAQTNSGAGWTLPARVGTVDGSLSITLAEALSMSLGAADACQGAAFTVALSAG